MLADTITLMEQTDRRAVFGGFLISFARRLRHPF